MDNILEVRDLKVSFYTSEGVIEAIDGVNFEIRKDETFGLVGETGCGKTVSSLSTVMLLPPQGSVEEGEVLLKRENGYDDLTEMDESEIKGIRGKEISMIFQETSEALNPVYTIEDQISEAILIHQKEELAKKAYKEIEDEMEKNNSFFNKISLEMEKQDYKNILNKEDSDDSLPPSLLLDIPLSGYERMREEAKKRSISMLDDVGIADPAGVAEKYPHELSSGMRQRVMIAIALSCKPSLLIADEPTSNLDVSIQAIILDLLDQLRDQYELSILYITHDLSVIAQICDRVGVMYAGRIVEIAETEELFYNPLHPYSQLLIKAVPSFGKEIKTIGGQVPELLSPPSGCRFHPRCPKAEKICSKQVPRLEKVGEEHKVGCHKI